MTSKPEAPAPTDRKAITLDFSNHPKLFAHITAQAKKDERSPSSWLRRYIAEFMKVGEETPSA